MCKPTATHQGISHFNTYYTSLTPEKQNIILFRVLLKVMHPKPKISMFFAQSQNYQPFNDICTSYSNLSKELKNVIGILIGQAVFKLWIKTVKMMF